MIQDEAGEKTKKEGEQGSEHTSSVAINPPSVKLMRDVNLSSFEKHSLCLAWATFLVLILTFIVFYAQLRESKTQTAIFRAQAQQAITDAGTTHNEAERQIQIANDQFISDQRPYVWLQDPSGEMGKSLGGVYGWNVYYMNYGRAPAIGLCSEAHLATGVNALKQVSDINHDTCKSKEGTILPPTRHEFITGFADHKPTDTEISQWMSLDFGLVVWGRLDYSDSSGAKYFSQFSMMRLQDGAVANCKGHDHIH